MVDQVSPLRESNPGPLLNASRVNSRIESFTEKGDVSFESMVRHAENGDAKYQFAVGLDYLKGSNGAKKSIPHAVRYFKMAADQEHPLAQANLGAMADEGVGMSKNEEIAAHYWQKACAKGVPQAFFNLGLYHESGQGGQERSNAKAVNCYRQAAARGYVNALVNLGVIYEEGREDIKEDVEFAIKCYKEAADNKGSAHAAYNLGNIYYEGRVGLKADVHEANKYYKLAKSLNFPHSVWKLRWQRWFQQNWFWIAGLVALTIQHVIIWITISLFWSIAALVVPLSMGMAVALFASRRK